MGKSLLCVCLPAGDYRGMSLVIRLLRWGADLHFWTRIWTNWVSTSNRDSIYLQVSQVNDWCNWPSLCLRQQVMSIERCLSEDQAGEDMLQLQLNEAITTMKIWSNCLSQHRRTSWCGERIQDSRDSACSGQAIWQGDSFSTPCKYRCLWTPSGVEAEEN